MGRLLVSTYEAGGSLFVSSGLILMVVVSISIMSLLIYGCADDGSGEPRWKRRHGGGRGGYVPTPRFYDGGNTHASGGGHHGAGGGHVSGGGHDGGGGGGFGGG